VRNIVGLLGEVGSGQISPAAALKIVRSGSRQQRPRTAPAAGLYMLRVLYQDPDRYVQRFDARRGKA